MAAWRSSWAAWRTGMHRSPSQGPSPPLPPPPSPLTQLLLAGCARPAGCLEPLGKVKGYFTPDPSWDQCWSPTWLSSFVTVEDFIPRQAHLYSEGPPPLPPPALRSSPRGGRRNGLYIFIPNKILFLKPGLTCCYPRGWERKSGSRGTDKAAEVTDMSLGAMNSLVFALLNSSDGN